MSQLKALDKTPFTRSLLLLLLLLLLSGVTIPSYMKGKWQWKEPPSVPGLKKLQELQGKGIKIPEWETQDQVMMNAGGNKWLLNNLKQGDREVLFLLRSQRGEKEQPQVEWMDINGTWRWEVDANVGSEFVVGELGTGNSELGTRNRGEILVKARYFRGITRQQTYAVMQWYAFPDGGHPSPGHWFWRDRLYQLSGTRQPWVAVCLIIPIEPYGDIEKTRPLAEDLAKKVQAALMAGPLK